MKKTLISIIKVVILLLSTNAGYAQDGIMSIYKYQYNVGQKYITFFQNGRFCYIDAPKNVMGGDYLYKGQGNYCLRDNCMSFLDDGDAVLSKSNERFIIDADSISLIFYSFNDNEFECRNYFTQIIINAKDTFFFEFGGCQNLRYNDSVQTIDFFFPPHTWLRYDTHNPTNTNYIEFYFIYSFDYNRVYLGEINAIIANDGERLILNEEKFDRVDSLPNELKCYLIKND